MRLRKKEWEVKTIPLKVVQEMVNKYHYSGGGANTATYRHGLFRIGDEKLLGVAWWIPPTKTAAKATYPQDWRAVLCLSRLVIHPDVPKNGASFLLGWSMRNIDRQRWPCLVTYADEMQGHTGQIYRATNWTYCGMTAKEACFFMGGRMIARKAGPKTRTHQEMLDMGCELVGRFAKHKFKHITSGSSGRKKPRRLPLSLVS